MSVLNVAKNLGVKHNVCIRIIDEITGSVVSEHEGHNAATNSMLTGIGHYLAGEGLNGQGELLDPWIPKYISLGTMGLINQDEDDEHLPAGIGVVEGTEEERFTDYMNKCPGFGSDGYNEAMMNNRAYAGLGPMFTNRAESSTINCELITSGFKRSPVTFRNVVPEYQAEYPETIDVVFSAMVSAGALAQFREPGKNYLFVTEIGLWSKQDWTTGGDNGLLAGYRIIPPNEANWDMSVEENRHILKENVIRVGVNQIIQIIWKIQLGAIDQLGAVHPGPSYMEWEFWDPPVEQIEWWLYPQEDPPYDTIEWYEYPDGEWPTRWPEWVIYDPQYAEQEWYVFPWYDEPTWYVEWWSPGGPDPTNYLPWYDYT